MALMAKVGGGAVDPIPEGVYVAVCYGVIDLGTHESKAFGGSSRNVLIQWELPDVRGDFERDGKRVNLPRAISKRYYTVSLHEKANLRRDLESWRGRKFNQAELAGFDLRAVLGAACQLQIVHEEKESGTHAKIAAIMALPKGTPRPKAENPLAFFSWEEANGKPELPRDLPEWICKIIMESREWAELHAPAQAAPAPTRPSVLPEGVSGDEAQDEKLPF